MTRDEIRLLVFDCLASLNAEREADAQIPVDDSTELLSERSRLDSLGFVSFSADLEDRLAARTGRSLMLASSALDGSENPFRSVRTLIAHIEAELGRP